MICTVCKFRYFNFLHFKYQRGLVQFKNGKIHNRNFGIIGLQCPDKNANLRAVTLKIHEPFLT